MEEIQYIQRKKRGEKTELIRVEDELVGGGSEWRKTETAVL